jgi:hypothetical protein
MPNTILTDDSFTDVTLDQSISGRAPTVRTGSAVWYLSPNTSAVTGGGNGDVKFAGDAHSAKVATTASGNNKAVQIELRAVDDGERYTIFLRDTANTGYVQNGYVLVIAPKETPSFLRVQTVISWDWAAIAGLPDTPWTFHPNFNIVAFEAINTDFRVIVNGVVAMSFTNSTIAFNSGANKDGFICTNRVNGNGRVERYTVYDSIELTEAPQYPIVYFG